MNISLDLIEECDYCSGDGWRIEYAYGKPLNKSEKVKCDKCNGKGSRPTFLGQEIIDLVRDYV